MEGRAGRRVSAAAEEKREVEDEGHVRDVGSESCVNDPLMVLYRTFSMDL